MDVSDLNGDGLGDGCSQEVVHQGDELAGGRAASREEAQVREGPIAKILERSREQGAARKEVSDSPEELWELLVTGTASALVEDAPLPREGQEAIQRGGWGPPGDMSDSRDASETGAQNPDWNLPPAWLAGEPTGRSHGVEDPRNGGRRDAGTRCMSESTATSWAQRAGGGHSPHGAPLPRVVAMSPEGPPPQIYSYSPDVCVDCSEDMPEPPLPAARRLVPGCTAGSPFSPPPGAPPTFEPQCARGGRFDRVEAVTTATNCPPLPVHCSPPRALSSEKLCRAAAEAQFPNGEAVRGVEEEEGGKGDDSVESEADQTQDESEASVKQVPSDGRGAVTPSSPTSIITTLPEEPHGAETLSDGGTDSVGEAQLERSASGRSPHAFKDVERPKKEVGAKGWPEQWSQEQIAQGNFLAHIFTRARRRWRWCRKAPRSIFPTIWRPAVHCQCSYGLNLAGPSEFAAQAKEAQAVLDWDRAQSFLLKRLESGRTPLILDLFCCAGGVSEGMRRAGCATFGVDQDAQPEFKARFGGGWFQQGDALDRQSIRALVRNCLLYTSPSPRD